MDKDLLEQFRLWLIHWESWTNWAYLDGGPPYTDPRNPTIGVGFNMAAGAPALTATDKQMQQSLYPKQSSKFFVANKSPGRRAFMRNVAGTTNYYYSILFDSARDNSPYKASKNTPHITDEQVALLLDKNISDALNICKQIFSNWSAPRYLPDGSENPLYICDAKKIALADLVYNMGYMKKWVNFKKAVNSGNWTDAVNNLIFTNGVSGKITDWYTQNHAGRGPSSPKGAGRGYAVLEALKTCTLLPGSTNFPSSTIQQKYNDVYHRVPRPPKGFDFYDLYDLFGYFGDDDMFDDLLAFGDDDHDYDHDLDNDLQDDEDNDKYSYGDDYPGGDKGGNDEIEFQGGGFGGAGKYDIEIDKYGNQKITPASR